MMLAACVCLAVAYAGGTNSIGRVARPAAARVRAVLEQPPAPTAAAPSVVSALRSALRRGEDLGELLAATQPFPLDGFQLDALTALLEGENVLLSAPTGSGKTAVGELAVLAALANGKKAVYTTPLKALSNQKFFDFCERFGSANVGLLTGDVTVQRDAPILLMTTEVFRNMLFDERRSNDRSAAGIPAEGDEETGEGRKLIDSIGVCVLDEFHWMGDRSRGVVWEEVVIHAPKSVQLLALSATVPNGKSLRRWIEATHGRPTRLVRSDVRPVPLRFHYCDGTFGVRPLFADPEAMPSAVAGSSSVLAAEKGGKRGGGGSERGGKGRGAKGGKNVGALKINPQLAPVALNAEVPARRGEKERESRRGGGASRGQPVGRGWDDFRPSDNRRPPQGAVARPPKVPSMPYLVRCLQRKRMLPAIVFIFSRAGCDDAAQWTSEACDLLTPSETASLKARVDAFERMQESEALADGGGAAVETATLKLLRAGVASHHAGQLPAFKKFAERLFADNLLKVVFATETLAAGVNMPCRTAVVTSLSKRGDNGIGPLGASVLLQMAGRAGRRGKDAVGHVVLAQSRWEGAEEAFSMVQRPPDPIASHFLLSYSSVLRTVGVAGGLDGARTVLERSYGSFVRKENEAAAAQKEWGEGGTGKKGAPPPTPADAGPQGRADALTSELAAVRAQLRLALELPAGAGEAVIAAAEEGAMEYASLAERCGAEENILRWLCVAREREVAERTADMLDFCRPGSRVQLGTGELAVLLLPSGNAYTLDAPSEGVDLAQLDAHIASQGLKKVLLLTTDGQLVVCTAAQVTRLELDDIELESDAVFALATSGPLASPPSRVVESGGAGAKARTPLPRVRLPPPICGAPGWKLAADGSYRCDAAALGPDANLVLRALALGVRPLPPLEAADLAEAPQVAQQRARLERLVLQKDAHPLHASVAATDVARLGASLAPLEKAEGKERKRAARRTERAAARQGVDLINGAAMQGSRYTDADLMWDSLCGAYDVLKEYGCFMPPVAVPLPPAAETSARAGDEDVSELGDVGVRGEEGAIGVGEGGGVSKADKETSDKAEAGHLARANAPQLSEFGQIVSSLGGENEVFLASVLMSANIFDGLEPHEVAAALSTLAAGEMRQGSACFLEPSQPVFDAVAQIEPVAVALLQAQARAGVDYPVSWSAQYAGLVQGWAAGMSWTEVMAETALDAGDVLRLLSRTIELLRGTLMAPYVPQHVRVSAREALSTFNRPPLQDDFLRQVQAAERASVRADATPEPRTPEEEDEEDVSENVGDSDDFDYVEGEPEYDEDMAAAIAQE